MLEFIFWFSVLMIFYAYFGYPLCLLIISLFKRSNNSKFKIQNSKLPYVSFIITAYNEEKRIEEKIKNSLAQDYPNDKLEIIIASDCSSDKTDEIVGSYMGQGIKLVRAPERKGKENAQKHAVEASKGEILVFSDVATILKPDAIANIVKNFADPTIGCVSSEDKFIDKDGNVSGEGAYVKYEMFLRSLETKVNTLVGLSGSFFAARKVVCKNWAIDLQSDFNTLLNSVKKGLRGISDPKSVGYYHNIADEKKEFQRKTRTVLRGISVLMRNLSLLNVRKYGLFSWQLFSHKLCRWLVPIFMILAFATNLLLAFGTGSLIFIFIVQTIFYAIAIFYYLSEVKGYHLVGLTKKNESSKKSTFLNYLIAYTLKLRPLFKIPYFFITVNYSILVAWFKFLRGERATFWMPSER